MDDANNEIRNQEDSTVGEYSRKSKDRVSINNHKKKVKRSLELVEHPPEGTYRPQSDKDEALSHTSPNLFNLSMKSSIPLIPTMPTTPLISTNLTISTTPSTSHTLTVPLVESKVVNTDATNHITTTISDVELIETTTEDYSDIEEPNCDYDPLQYILKCGLSLITSIFGLSDICCKPIF